MTTILRQTSASKQYILTCQTQHAALCNYKWLVQLQDLQQTVCAWHLQARCRRWRPNGANSSLALSCRCRKCRRLQQLPRQPPVSHASTYIFTLLDLLNVACLTMHFGNILEIASDCSSGTGLPPKALGTSALLAQALPEAPYEALRLVAACLRP